MNYKSDSASLAISFGFFEFSARFCPEGTFKRVPRSGKAKREFCGMIL